MAWGYQELDNSVYANGRAGWSGVGVVLKGQPTPDEAFEQAGLGYRVDREPLFRKYKTEKNGIAYREIHVGGLTARMDLPASDHRSDLAVVSNGYSPIQNRDGVLAIASQMHKEAGAQVETAGTLYNGKKVWVLMALPTGDHIKEDRIARFVLITNAHDSTGALTVAFTNVRVVCANTLAMALGGAQWKYSVRHSEKAEERIAQVITLLSDGENYFKAAVEKFEHWADTPVGDELAGIFIEKFKTTDAEKVRTYTENQQQKIFELFQGKQRGGNTVGVKATAYGLYNAVTEWIDHQRVTRARRGKELKDGTRLPDRTPAESRFNSVMFGSGAQERQKAAFMINEMVRAIDDNNGKETAGVDALMSGIDFGATITNKIVDEIGVLVDDG